MLKRKPRPYTQGQFEAEYLGGKTFEELAAHFGVSFAMVQKDMLRFGIPARAAKPRDQTGEKNPYWKGGRQATMDRAYAAKEMRACANSRDLPDEVWSTVEGFGGKYQVSTRGRVKSFARYRNAGRVMIPAAKGDYLAVNLQHDGFFKKESVHRLVAMAFIPNTANKPDINHINGMANDNRLENLEWCTARENTVHAYANGKKYRSKGFNAKCSVLTKQQVFDIQRLLPTMSQRRIASRFNVSQKTVCRVNRGEYCTKVDTQTNIKR